MALAQDVALRRERLEAARLSRRAALRVIGLVVGANDRVAVIGPTGAFGGADMT